MNIGLKDEFNLDIWNSWINKNARIFESLAFGSCIAVSITEYTDNIVLLQKENSNLKVDIKELKFNELGKYADLLFIINKKDINKMLNDKTPSKFIELLCSGRIEIHELINHLKLVEKGYNIFLYRLGLNLGEESCCG